MLTTWLRLELPRRWRSLAVLALLVVLATGTVLAAAAGARRGDSAVDRLVARTAPADAVALPNQPHFPWNRVTALPEIAAITLIPLSDIPVEGVDEDDQLTFPLGTDTAPHRIERPVVLAGRLPRPDSLTEAVITAKFPGHYGKGVGDRVTYRLYSPAQADAGDATARPAGPAIHARIVGIVRSPWFSDRADAHGSIIPPPGVFARYHANILGAHSSIPSNALIRLRHGEADLPRFRADLARVSGRSDIDVWNQADARRHQQKVNRFESTCLYAFGLAALIAAVVLIGQSIARYTSATVVDLQILWAVGMTPRQSVIVAAAGPFLAAVVGATVGVAGAAGASPWLPIGAAANLEPDPGFALDWSVLATGWVLAPLAVLAAAAATSWLALLAHRRDPTPRPSIIAAAAARAGLPVSALVGVRFALEPGRGRGAVPVRPALLGAVAGVLGVLAAFTFSAGVSDAATNRIRFGQTHQLEAFLGDTAPDQVARLTDTLARQPDVAAVNDARVDVASVGNVSVTMYTYRPVGHRLATVFLAGRLPRSATEVALAPTSATRLHAHVGSALRLSGRTGARRLTVSGIGFVPEGFHNGYDDGGWLTPGGYDRIFTATAAKFHLAEVALRPGVSTAAALPALNRALAPITHGAPILLPAERPDQIGEIKDVRTLPVVLGGFLLLLAVGAVGHALATAVRRRRHDLAVLRALGMTRGQCRAVVAVQATLLAVIGLAFGVPIGFALGRTLWRSVASDTPLAYHPPLAFWALLLIAPVALVVANLLAAWPGRHAARLRIGQILRTE